MFWRRWKCWFVSALQAQYLWCDICQLQSQDPKAFAENYFFAQKIYEGSNKPFINKCNIIWPGLRFAWYCVNSMPIAYWCLWVNSSLSLHSCVTWHLPIIHKVKWSLTLQNLYCIWWYMNIEQTCTAHYAVFCNKVKKVHQCNTLVPAREMRSDFH